MPDPLNEKTRTRLRAQRRRDTGVEVKVRKGLHARGLRFRVDHRLEVDLRTRGDVVFTRRKVVVFVDGCFWHCCPTHGTLPRNNEEWWRAKLAANVERDRRVRAELSSRGWIVVSTWEHDDPEKVVIEVERALQLRG